MDWTSTIPLGPDGEEYTFVFRPLTVLGQLYVEDQFQAMLNPRSPAETNARLYNIMRAGLERMEGPGLDAAKFRRQQLPTGAGAVSVLSDEAMNVIFTKFPVMTTEGELILNLCAMETLRLNKSRFFREDSPFFEQYKRVLEGAQKSKKPEGTRGKRS